MKRQNAPYAVFFGAVLFLALADDGAATTLLKLSIEEMSVKADAIVVGKVVDQVSAESEDKTTIYTLITVRVSLCVAGPCGDEVKLKQRGGRVGERELLILGMPKFAKGRKYLLFLHKWPGGATDYWGVLGMCQGAFDVTVDDTSGKEIATQQVGAALAALGASGKIEILPPKEPLRMPLVKLIKQIRQARRAAASAGGTK